MKLALCNEVLGQLPFAEQCRLAAAFGYQGLELAPFTVVEDCARLEPTAGIELARVAADHGLTISGLHWLLAGSTGLSITAPEQATRDRTVDFLARMIEFAVACGAGLLVHGSPQQRTVHAGQTHHDAMEYAVDSWSRLAPLAEAAGLVYCIEPLAPATSPVLNTLAQAVAVVDRIGSPALRTMIDLGASSRAETEAVDVVSRRHLASGHIAHIQLNDQNRRGPGQGDTAVAPLLETLRDGHYQGWVAVEPFDYYPDPIGCTAFCAGYVNGLWAGLQRMAGPG